MFAQLAKLIPKGGVINMTLSQGATEGHVRLTLAPYRDGKQPWAPLVFADVKPEELDDPAISFEPIAEVVLNITDAIAKAAKDTKDSGKTDTKVEPTAAGGSKTTTKGPRGSRTVYSDKPQPAAAPAAPPVSMANVPAASTAPAEEDKDRPPMALEPEETAEQKAARLEAEKAAQEAEDKRKAEEAAKAEAERKQAEATSSLSNLQDALSAFSDDDILSALSGGASKPAA